MFAASLSRPTLDSQRGLSGKLKIVDMTMNDNSIGKASGKRQEKELEAYEVPKSIQSARTRPIPAKMPNAETWLPRLLAFDNSDCQTEVVAMMPPVPNPRTILETMNWAKENEEHMRMAPMALNRQDIQNVERRPYLSPKKVQAKAPSVPTSV